MNFSYCQQIPGNRRTVLLFRVERFRRRRDSGSQKKDTEDGDGEQHSSGKVQGKSGGSEWKMDGKAVADRLEAIQSETTFMETAETALEDILGMEKRLTDHFDMKNELMEAREERYGHIG